VHYQSPTQLAQCPHAIPQSFQLKICTSGWTVLPLPSSSFQGQALKWVFVPFFLPMWLTLFDWNDFANRDQKSLFATFQSHRSISSIRSVNELQCHSVNVRANYASIIFWWHHHAACIVQRAAARPAWVLLTAGGTNGHPLQLGRFIESLWLTIVRSMNFYTLVPKFFADPPTHSATIWWGLPRTGRSRILSVQRVQQKILASASGLWLDHVPLSLFMDYFSCGAHVTISRAPVT